MLQWEPPLESTYCDREISVGSQVWNHYCLLLWWPLGITDMEQSATLGATSRIYGAKCYSGSHLLNPQVLYYSLNWYCYCYCYCTATDGHHLLFGLLRPGLLRPTVYCTVTPRDVPHITILTEWLLWPDIWATNWMTDELTEMTGFNTERTFILNPLYALYYSLGFSSLLIYICRCTGTRLQLGASGKL